MATLIREQEDGSDDIVLVPVPKRYLLTVYRALADAMASATIDVATVPDNLPQVAAATSQNMIDLIIEVARRLKADQQPVSVAELHRAYLQAYPGIGKGTTAESFNATVSYYTINMRSRFFYKDDKRRSASWLSQPIFKRLGRGEYMLLSSEEIARFRQCVEEDNSLVYADEYDVADLVPGK